MEVGDISEKGPRSANPDLIYFAASRLGYMTRRRCLVLPSPSFGSLAGPALQAQLPSGYWRSNGLITCELDRGSAMWNADCSEVQAVSAFVQHPTQRGSSVCVATTALLLAFALKSLA